MGARCSIRRRRTFWNCTMSGLVRMIFGPAFMLFLGILLCLTPCPCKAAILEGAEAKLPEVTQRSASSVRLGPSLATATTTQIRSGILVPNELQNPSQHQNSRGEAHCTTPSVRSLSFSPCLFAVFVFSSPSTFQLTLPSYLHTQQSISSALTMLPIAALQPAGARFPRPYEKHRVSTS